MEKKAHRKQKLAEEAFKNIILLGNSQSVDETSDLKLTDIVDIYILQKLQDGFAESYNVASTIFDDKNKPITKPSNFSEFCKIIRSSEKGTQRCEISDASLSRLATDGSSAIAPCGNFKEIMDGVVPILIGNKIVATWTIGQKVTSKLHEDNVQSYAKTIGVDPDQLVSAAKKLKLGSKEEFRQAVSFLEIVANNISLLGMQNLHLSHEIAERKQAKKELDRLSKDREEIFQALGHATIILDTNFNITGANRAIAAATGKSQEELIGKKCYKIFHNTDKPPEGCPTVQVLTSSRGEPCTAEMEALGGILSVFCTPVFDTGGNIEKIIHVCTDITDQKRTEDELKKKNEDLEKFNQMAVGRELKMIELKKEINALSVKSGRELKYKIVDES